MAGRTHLNSGGILVRAARRGPRHARARALVCLAGGVNYRDERNPTGAMTPTVVEG
jgi:hypothetical protein